jgi:hypothetical protein
VRHVLMSMPGIVEDTSIMGWGLGAWIRPHGVAGFPSERRRLGARIPALQLAWHGSRR